MCLRERCGANCNLGCCNWVTGCQAGRKHWSAASTTASQCGIVCMADMLPEMGAESTPRTHTYMQTAKEASATAQGSWQGPIYATKFPSRLHLHCFAAVSLVWLELLMCMLWLPLMLVGLSALQCLCFAALEWLQSWLVRQCWADWRIHYKATRC